MIIEKKRFIFNTAEIVLEDDKIKEYLNRKNKYSRISILTYQQLDLNEKWKMRHELTPKIYLDDSLEEIFDQFNDTTRKKIRRTLRRDDLVFKINDDNYKGIYELYKNFEYSKGRAPFPFSAMKICKIFSAYYKDRPISAIYYFNCFPYLRARSIFSKRLQAKDDKELYKIISCATARLVYEICKYGKENNYKLFDLGHINLTDPKKAGIAQFKQGFNGQLENEYTYVYKSRMFKLFEKLIILKLWIYKILKK